MKDAGDMEHVEDFAARARSWLPEHMPRAADGVGGFRGVRGTDEDELAHIEECRRLQRRLFDGGFAGICVPLAYGGQGLTAAHQAAFNQEIRGYAYPAETQVPTLTPCMSLILEFGTEEQKMRHVPPILRGEALWMQFLSEPSGGSDLAGALTTAVRDGDEWVLNGSKIWTTGAWWADWALCLARTNWDVPKHRGLSVFMLEIHQPGIEVHRIEMLNGSREFCQEFMTDVRVPDSLANRRCGRGVDRRYAVDVPRAHDRRRLDRTSPCRPADRPWRLDTTGGPPALLPMIRSRGLAEDTRVQGADRRITTPSRSSVTPSPDHVAEQIRTGEASEQWAALIRLWYGTAAVRNSTIGFEVAGSTAVAWSDEERELGQIGDPLPDAAGLLHCRWHDRDGPQRDQRTGARHAP